MDRLNYFGDGDSIGAVGFVVLGFVVLTLVIAAIYGLYGFCSQILSINKETQKNVC